MAEFVAVVPARIARRNRRTLRSTSRRVLTSPAGSRSSPAPSAASASRWPRRSPQPAPTSSGSARRSRPTGSRVERPSRRTGAASGASPSTSPTASAVAALAADVTGATAGRHPGQQRRHHPRAPAAEHPTRTGTTCSRSTCTRQFVLAREIGRAHGRARPRQDHLHRLAAELPGRHQRARLCRGEVRRRRARPGRWPTNGPARASTSTRSRPATSRPTTPRRCRTIPAAAAPILERIPAGRWGEAERPRRRGGVPRLAASDYVSGVDAAGRRRVAWPMTDARLRRSARRDRACVPVVVLDDAGDAAPLARRSRGGLLVDRGDVAHAAARAGAIAAHGGRPAIWSSAPARCCDREQVDRAVEAGARFIVSPGLSPPWSYACHELGVPVLPGVATPTEMQAALDLGLRRGQVLPGRVARRTA